MTTPIDFGILLGLAYRAFVEALRADLTARGFDDLGSSYGYVFRALAERSLYLHELARRLGITPQGAAKLINEMAERGYVERHPDPEDGRAKHLKLSARGRAALAAARRFHSKFERQLGASHGPGEVRELRRLLEAIVAKTGEDPNSVPLRPI